MINIDVPVQYQTTDLDRSINISSAVAFLAICYLYRGFVADDAYIVGRYALNAAAGHGLVYNIGEQISALTSPLHALLESLLALCGLDPVDSYRVLAPILVLIGWYVAQRESGLSGSRLLFFNAFSLFSPFLALWTVGGLETPMLTCFASLFISRLVVVYRNGEVRSRDLYRLGVLAALMFLTRHDSVLITAPILLAITLVEFRKTSLWAAAALCLALSSSWLVFSKLYYGDVLPTSYYVKFSLGGRAPIDSLSALLNFVLLSGLAIIALFLRPDNTNKSTLLSKAIVRGAVISAALFLIYASRASGQHMMFGYRLFVPYTIGIGLVAALAMPSPRPALSILMVAWQAVMVSLVFFAGINPAPLTRLPGLDRAYTEYQFITPNTYAEFMDMLREDAQEISAHWHETGNQEQPRIYLRTGGTGYWLPDFYVYETLVSYRHGCSGKVRDSILSAHYMQQLGFSRMGTIVEDLGRSRPDVADDAALMYATEMDWMGTHVTGYLYGPEPANYRPGSKITDGCSASAQE